MSDAKQTEVAATRLYLREEHGASVMSVDDLTAWAREFVLADGVGRDAIAPGALCHSLFGWLLWLRWGGPVGVEAQAEVVRRIGVEPAEAFGGAAMWREVPGRVVIEMGHARWEWDRLVGLLVELPGGGRWAGALPLRREDRVWVVGPGAGELVEAVAFWPSLVNGHDAACR